MSMVIKLSFSAKMGKKDPPTAGKRNYTGLHMINVVPRDDDKGGEGGGSVFAKRYACCDGEGERE